MFERVLDGVALRFHLAGINNQNFLMRDEQTGTFWQQITGLAIAGPLAGKRLRLVSADELTFALWKTEQPGGSVLDDVTRYTRHYSSPNWDVKIAKAPTVISYAQGSLKARDLVLGVRAFGASRAFLYTDVLKQKLIQDSVGSEPVLLVVGPDESSVRVFRRRIRGHNELTQFYRLTGDIRNKLLMDAASGSVWDFEGCAASGKLHGVCLQQVDVIKDYWFDWRNYNPQTTVYGIKQKIR